MHTCVILLRSYFRMSRATLTTYAGAATGTSTGVAAGAATQPYTSSEVDSQAEDTGSN